MSSFWGVFGCLLQLSIDKVKAGHCRFERPGPRGRFLAEIRVRSSIFPSNAKKDSPLVPFPGRLGKIFKLSAPIWTIYASLLELSTFWRNLLPSNILRHILKPTLATAPVWQMRLTRWVHSLGRGLYFKGNFWLCTCLVSRICYSGAVTNVDSSCAVVCWMATVCITKLKAPVVKQKSFELEQKAWRFFQVDHERGPMDYLSLCWREKSSCGFEFQRENGLAVQVFWNSNVQPWLHP